MGFEVGMAPSVESEMGYWEKTSPLRAAMLKRQGVCGQTGPSWHWPSSSGQNPWGGAEWIFWARALLAALLAETSHYQMRRTPWTCCFHHGRSPCSSHRHHRVHFPPVQCTDLLVPYLGELKALQRLLEQEEFTFHPILLILTINSIVSFKQFITMFTRLFMAAHLL